MNLSKEFDKSNHNSLIKLRAYEFEQTLRET